MKPHSIELVCKELVELVTEYLGRAMAPDDRVRLEQHLLACPPCTAYLAQVGKTIELTRGLAQSDSGDAPGGDELIVLFRRWDHERPRS